MGFVRHAITIPSIPVMKNIYSHLSDPTSRFLYEKRCMYSQTGDRRYIDDILASLLDKEKADALIDKACQVSDKLVIRGLGNEYHTLKRLYPGLSFCCIADRDPVKVNLGEYDGKKIISLEELYTKHPDSYILITSSAYHESIVEELKEHGFRPEQLLDFGGLCRIGEQYFEAGIVSPQEHEVFIDGGCYDGNTVREFARWCAGSYDRIFSFEPDKKNYELALKGFWGNPVRALTLLNKGLWDKQEVLRFEETGGQGSQIVAGAADGKGIADDKGISDGKGTADDEEAIDGKDATYGKGTVDRKEAADDKVFSHDEGSADGKASSDSKASSGSASSYIETISIDEVLQGSPATLIKLDVEGAEYKALLGAEKTIRQYHPRLAVSIYHKPEDIFTLPELILDFSPDYRFYLRHYQLSPCETILYAV